MSSNDLTTLILTLESCLESLNNQKDDAVQLQDFFTAAALRSEGEKLKAIIANLKELKL
jgi:hypothetical protein